MQCTCKPTKFEEETIAPKLKDTKFTRISIITQREK